MFLSEEDYRSIRPVLKSGKTACIVCACAVVLYVAVALILLGVQGRLPKSPDGPGGSSAPEGMAQFALAVVGMGLLAAGYLVRGVLLRRAAHRGFGSPKDAAAFLVWVTFIACAMAETPAIMGLIFFLLGGGIGTLALLAAASILAITALFPTIGRVEMLLEEARLAARG
jgi:hypothetical protein